MRSLARALHHILIVQMLRYQLELMLSSIGLQF